MTTRRQVERTPRPRTKAGLPTPVLDPSRRIVTARPRPAPPRPAAPTPRARPRRPTRPSHAERAWAHAQRLAQFLWRHRREPNLWLSLLVGAEVLVLLALLLVYWVLAV